MKTKQARASKRDESAELLGGWLPRSWYGEDAGPGSSYPDAHITQKEIAATRETVASAIDALTELERKLDRQLCVEPGRYNLLPHWVPLGGGFYYSVIQSLPMMLNWFLKNTADPTRERRAL